MIRLENIHKSYAKIPAINDVSFDIPRSQITILAGADGAGKSTIFKTILGLEKMDQGKIFLEGQNIYREFQRITSIAGYMPERFSLYPDLSVEENMNFFADIYQVPHQRRDSLKEKLLQKTGMSQFTRRKAGALSGGMKQKLALSTILLSAPEFIILDEPTTGVDPLSRIEFLEIITQLKEEGKTIIMSTPYLDEAEKGDYIVFLKEGRIIQKDSLVNLRGKFPAKLFSIIPKGNIFEIIEKLKRDNHFKGKVYIKGKYIKYLQTDETTQPTSIPHLSFKEDKPGLEDIYLFYEREGNQTGKNAHE